MIVPCWRHAVRVLRSKLRVHEVARELGQVLHECAAAEETIEATSPLRLVGGFGGSVALSAPPSRDRLAKLLGDKASASVARAARGGSGAMSKPPACLCQLVRPVPLARFHYAAKERHFPPRAASRLANLNVRFSITPS